MGGSFDHTGVSGQSPNQVAAMNVAALDLSTLDSSKTEWSGLGSGVGNDAHGDGVGSLGTIGGTLYIGGEFPTAGGAPAVGVAQWSIGSSAWSPLGSGLDCQSNDCGGLYANSVDAAPDGLYLAGNFAMAGDRGSQNVARWVPIVGTNLLANPGFETANSSGEPDSWVPPTTNAVRSKTLVHSGTDSMRLLATNAGQYTIGQQVGGITAGRQYIVGTWTAIPKTSAKLVLTVDVQWLNGTGTVLRTDTVRTYKASTGGWDDAALIAAPPSGVASAVVRYTVSNASTKAAYAYVDYASLGVAP